MDEAMREILFGWREGGGLRFCVGVESQLKFRFTATSLILGQFDLALSKYSKCSTV
jgi:hypothetical protein